MCGIAGQVNFDSEPCREKVLEKMLRSIAHRGPDSLSGVKDCDAMIGTARLSIVDIEGGLQPAVNRERQVSVVFNGEIYNYKELGKALRRTGQSLKNFSEVEVLLELYLRDGPGFVSLLNGQFAIAIWDGKERNLHLFRDRLGIRPLFWTQQGHKIFFASEVKALFASGVVSAGLDVSGIRQSFRFWTTVGEQTAFQNVFQVMPGNAIKFSRGRLQKTRYWRLPRMLESDLAIGSLRDEEYIEQFLSELTKAVDLRLMADVPVSSYLSGGIDSSAIAFLASKKYGGSLETFSVGFDDSHYDESAAQQTVARHLGVANSRIEIHSKDIDEWFPQVVWHAETPLFRTAPVPMFLLSKLVHNKGRKVVLTGEGADEILLGYDLFRETAIRRFWARNPDSSWRGKLLRRTHQYLPQYRSARYAKMLEDFYKPFLRDGDDPFFPMAVRWANNSALDAYFSDDVLEQCPSNQALEYLSSLLPKNFSELRDEERSQHVECETLLSNYLLSSQGDRMSLAHGVEGRYPFLDHNFIEFCAALPTRIKLRGLKDKYIMRRALKEELPEAVYNRPKVAYQAPDVKGFFVEGKASEYVYEMLSPERISKVGMFSSEAVALLQKKCETIKADRVGIRDNMALSLILSTQLLAEIFIEKSLSFESDVETITSVSWRTQ